MKAEQTRYWIGRGQTEKELNGVQVVGGSNPLAPTKKSEGLALKAEPAFVPVYAYVTRQPTRGVTVQRHSVKRPERSPLSWRRARLGPVLACTASQELSVSSWHARFFQSESAMCLTLGRLVIVAGHGGWSATVSGPAGRGLATPETMHGWALSRP